MPKIAATALAIMLVACVGGMASAQPAATGEGEATPAVLGGAPVDLSAVPDDTEITIVLMSSLEGSAGLDDAMTPDGAALEQLRGSLEDNAPIKAKLEAGGYAVKDVIAVANSVSGSVIVYVDDRT
ncbi:hypothetical protein [uncultured Devosia sp.]|uniref:hypothetical protein n=1 Tax=uncultured Devosia sp. TaxID=211434 RepID=UPI0035CABD2E